MGKFAAFLGGFFVGAIALAGGVAATAAFLPTKNYVNINGAHIVGEKIGNNGLLTVVTSINDYTVDDLPVIKDLLDRLFAEGGLGDLVTIDYEQIKDTRLTDNALSEKLKNAMVIKATLDALNVDLGAFGNLNAFKEWTPFTPTAAQLQNDYKAYYYKDANGNYARAYDDTGKPVAGYQAGSQLYLPKLSAIPVMDLFNGLSVRLNELTYKDFLVGFMGASESSLKDDTIYKLIGNMKLSELKSLDADEFHLADVIKPSDSNAKVFDLLRDLTGKSTNEEIQLKDLSSLDVGNAKLTTVIAYNADTAKLYTILCDMTGIANYQDIKVSSLDNPNLDNIHLSSVFTSDQVAGNFLLQTLLSDEDVTMGNLPDKINALSVHKLFGNKCFTVNPAEAIRTDTYRFDANSGVYTYDTAIPANEDTYYVSVNAGVWLLLAYDTPNTDPNNGRALTFSPATTSYANLQNNPEGFSQSIGDAKIYQLMSAGIVTGDYNANVTRLSLNEILAAF